MSVRPGEVYRVNKTGKMLVVKDVWYDGYNDTVNVTFRDNPTATISDSSREADFLAACSLAYSEHSSIGT